MSLKAWEETGLFDREVALYRAMRPMLGGITLVTYGDATDLDYRRVLDGIDIVCNRWGLNWRLYHLWLRHFQPFEGNQPQIFKSNQTLGAEIALAAARRVKAFFIARCGYPLADFECRAHGDGSSEARRAARLEEAVFSKADWRIVTTTAMRDSLVRRHGLVEQRFSVVPNYVDTEHFHPSGTADPGKICFVGRLTRQKNIPALFEAIEGLDVELQLVGGGDEDGRLRAMATERHLPVKFLGVLPHGSLGEVINGAEIFVLPSFWEGHPKTLLEAMSCGRAVIGADVAGIRETIQDNVTGLLCGTDAADIRKKIELLLNDPDRRHELGANARKFIEQTVSLERVVQAELEVYSHILASDGPQ